MGKGEETSVAGREHSAPWRWESVRRAAVVTLIRRMHLQYLGRSGWPAWGSAAERARGGRAMLLSIRVLFRKLEKASYLPDPSAANGACTPCRVGLTREPCARRALAPCPVTSPCLLMLSCARVPPPIRPSIRKHRRARMSSSVPMVPVPPMISNDCTCRSCFARLGADHPRRAVKVAWHPRDKGGLRSIVLPGAAFLLVGAHIGLEVKMPRADGYA